MTSENDGLDEDDDVVEMLLACDTPLVNAKIIAAGDWPDLSFELSDLRAMARWARERQDRAWCAGRDAAAKVVEDNTETLTSSKDGTSFATAIRALSPPATLAAAE